jgi:hypothetical protein
METKAAAKFAPLLVSHAAERLDVMRREGDLKICGICNLRMGWDGRLVSARKIAVVRASRVELSDA